MQVVFINRCFVLKLSEGNFLFSEKKKKYVYIHAACVPFTEPVKKKIYTSFVRNIFTEPYLLSWYELPPRLFQNFKTILQNKGNKRFVHIYKTFTFSKCEHVSKKTSLWYICHIWCTVCRIALLFVLTFYLLLRGIESSSSLSY